MRAQNCRNCRYGQWEASFEEVCFKCFLWDKWERLEPIKPKGETECTDQPESV